MEVRFKIEVSGFESSTTYFTNSSSALDDIKRIAENLSGMDDECQCDIYVMRYGGWCHIGTYRMDSEFVPTT